MTRLEIVGGGLTGVLAALQAHSQGLRDITLYEAGDHLGGRARPRAFHGQELRETAVYFGGPEDPARRLLEAAGVVFQEVELHCGSVSPTPSGGMTAVQDFAGPALFGRSLGLADPVGATIADRIRAYPSDLQAPLARYAEWRLGGWIDQTHESAAPAIGLDSVYPLAADPSTLDELRRVDSLYDALYGAPVIGGRGGPQRASQPRDGFSGMFEALRRRLDAMDVQIRLAALRSPQQVLDGCLEGGCAIWATAPDALYRPLGVDAPTTSPHPRATYIFKARTSRPAPSLVRNFTAEGVVARLHLYESRGEILLSADCVAETDNDALRREIHRLVAAFGGEELHLGEQVSHTVTTDLDCPSMSEISARETLAAILRRRTAGRLVVASCEPWRIAQGLREMSRSLSAAVASAPQRLARAS